MANNFITNNKQHKTLRGRLNKLIGISDELKFLVGFFYFSGWKELYQRLQEHEHIKVKLLVGLEVERRLGNIIMESKIGHLPFDGDMEAILRPGVEYSQEEAWEWMQEVVIAQVKL